MYQKLNRLVHMEREELWKKLRSKVENPVLKILFQKGFRKPLPDDLVSLIDRGSFLWDTINRGPGNIPVDRKISNIFLKEKISVFIPLMGLKIILALLQIVWVNRALEAGCIV